MTLKEMRASQRIAWASKVIDQIKAEADLEQDHFIILAGKHYRKYLIPHLMSCEIPLKNFTIGKQLQFLKNRVGDV